MMHALIRLGKLPGLASGLYVVVRECFARRVWLQGLRTCECQALTSTKHCWPCHGSVLTCKFIASTTTGHDMLLTRLTLLCSMVMHPACQGMEPNLHTTDTLLALVQRRTIAYPQTRVAVV